MAQATTRAASRADFDMQVEKQTIAKLGDGPHEEGGGEQRFGMQLGALSGELARPPALVQAIIRDYEFRVKTKWCCSIGEKYDHIEHIPYLAVAAFAAYCGFELRGCKARSAVNCFAAAVRIQQQSSWPIHSIQECFLDV